MLKNTVQPVRPQTTTRRVLIACWISKATNTHTEYVIIIPFPLQQWLYARASMLRYTYISLSSLLRKERLQIVSSVFYWTAAIWLCYVVLHSRCSTASSASQKTYNPIKMAKEV